VLPKLEIFSSGNGGGLPELMTKKLYGEKCFAKEFGAAAMFPPSSGKFEPQFLEWLSQLDVA
jgi:hypothetical protein